MVFSPSEREFVKYLHEQGFTSEEISKYLKVLRTEHTVAKNKEVDLSFLRRPD